MRDFASAVAGMGQRGDDSVAHVRTGEMVIPQSRMTPKLMSAFLEAMGGTDPSKFVVGNPANQRNTATGMPMFADDEDGSAGFGAGEGGFADTAGPSFSGPATDAYESSIGGPVGGGLSTAGYNPANDPNFGMDPGDPVGDSRGGSEVGSFGRAAASMFSNALGIPGNVGAFAAGPAYAAITGREMSPFDAFGTMASMSPGFGLAAAGARGLAELGGRGIQSVMEAAGLNPQTNTTSQTGQMGPTAEGGGDGEVASLGEQMAAETAKQNFTPPAAMQAPASLRLNPQMTELQQRTMVASRGTQGDDSRYRTEEAQNFYRNLLQRALIGQGGAVNPLSSLLPVDMQFIQQVLGIKPPDSSSALLQAIANT